MPQKKAWQPIIAARFNLSGNIIISISEDKYACVLKAAVSCPQAIATA
jgi:hypothetical protein